MKKVLVSVMLGTMMLLMSGCASMMNYSGSKGDYVKRVATQRAQVSNDQTVVKAVGEGNYIKAGIDLADPAFWDVMAEHPIRATVAAVTDLATAAAATWGVTATLDRSHHDSNTITVNGNNNTTSYNNGQGNTVNNNPATTTDSHNQ